MTLAGDGTVWAWGRNESGQLGDGTSTDRYSPVEVTDEFFNPIEGVVSVAAGKAHSVALKSDGTVWTWGTNGNGQLGNGTRTASLFPVQVSGLDNVKAVVAGDYHTLALKTDGTVWAWGRNDDGQMGNSSFEERTSPVQTTGLANVVAVAAGVYHSLALKNDVTVYAWGSNDSGQLGDDSVIERHTPVQTTGLTGVSEIAGGNGHSVALKSNGTVWCWGDNDFGQLGDGSDVERHTPVQSSGLEAVTAIAAGADHCVALKSDGRAFLKPVPFMVMLQIDYVSATNDCKGYETCYDTLQEAIDEAIVKTSELKIQLGQYGTVSFNGCYYFRLYGGFDDYYSGIVSASSIEGPVVIDREIVEFVNVEIR